MYRIVEWNDHFENNRTRDLQNMRWVPIPNKLDGDGYTELVEHENGAAHFGCWIALVEIASRCETRGTLLRGGGKPHDFDSLARISRMPRSLFAEAIPRLIEIGWVEEINHYNSSVYEKSHESADKSHVSASRSQGTDYGMEWNGMEEKGMEEKGMEKKEDVVRTTSREADASPANRKNRIPSADIDSVVQHYQGYHPQAKPGRKERAKIADRIRDGYSADELKAAIDGCHQSPFHCGENERGKKYQALDLIMRDSDHVVQFIETLERAGPRLSEKNQRTLRAAQAYVERKRREQKSD